MAEIIVLRLVHVLGGLFWIGGGLFNGIYLMPALAEAGPAAGKIMGSLQRRHLFTVLPVVAALTILAGLRLMWITSGGFAPEYFATGRGATFALSGAAAIVAFLVGIFVSRPGAVRMGVIRQTLAQMEDGETRDGLVAELGLLERRLGRVGRVLNVLLILAAAGMAVARYV
jgi:uncharacterized membrane protein